MVIIIIRDMLLLGYALSYPNQKKVLTPHWLWDKLHLKKCNLIAYSFFNGSVIIISRFIRVGILHSLMYSKSN